MHSNVKDMGSKTTGHSLTNQLITASSVVVSWPIPKDSTLILSLSVLKASTIDKINFKNNSISQIKGGQTFS